MKERARERERESERQRETLAGPLAIYYLPGDCQCAIGSLECHLPDLRKAYLYGIPASLVVLFITTYIVYLRYPLFCSSPLWLNQSRVYLPSLHPRSSLTTT